MDENLNNTEENNSFDENEKEFRQVKDSNLKTETKDFKNYIKNIFKNPIEEIKKCTLETKDKILKNAIIILAIWIIAILLKIIFNDYLYGYTSSFSFFIKQLLVNLLTPIISVGILSGVVYAINPKSNKSYLNIASTIIIAKIPIVIASIFSLINIIGNEIGRITSLFSGYCNILSTVLLYFAIKEIFEENENNKIFWKFSLIMGIFYIAKLIFSFLGIYL